VAEGLFGSFLLSLPLKSLRDSFSLWRAKVQEVAVRFWREVLRNRLSLSQLKLTAPSQREPLGKQGLGLLMHPPCEKGAMVCVPGESIFLKCRGGCLHPPALHTGVSACGALAVEGLSLSQLKLTAPSQREPLCGRCLVDREPPSGREVAEHGEAGGRERDGRMWASAPTVPKTALNG